MDEEGWNISIPGEQGVDDKTQKGSGGKTGTILDRGVTEVETRPRNDTFTSCVEVTAQDLREKWKSISVDKEAAQMADWREQMAKLST